MRQQSNMREKITLGVAVFVLAGAVSCWGANPRPAQQQSESIDRAYVMLKIPAGEGLLDYLLLEIDEGASGITGRAFYLTYAFHPIPSKHLTTTEVINYLREGQGSCVPLRGTRKGNKMLLETDEVRIGREKQAKYKWKLTTSFDHEELTWQVHEVYWLRTYGYFPTDHTLKAPWMRKLPASLGAHRECASEKASDRNLQ